MAILFHNLFVALQPTAAVKQEIGRLRSAPCQDFGRKGRHVREENLHTSLCSLGEHRDVPDQLIARAVAALAKITIPPFVVALNRLQGWKGRAGRQPLVMTGDDGVVGIDMLCGQVNSCLVGAGLVAPLKSSGVPHVTLLYGDVVGFDRLVEPVRWVVRELVLVDSHVGANRHVVLHRQALT